MTADIIPFPRKPRLLDGISMVESLDSFGKPDPTAPAWPMLGNHRLREQPPVGPHQKQGESHD